MARFTKTMLMVAVCFAVVGSALAPALSVSASMTETRPATTVTITLYGSASPPRMGWGFGPNNISEPGPNITVQQGDTILFHLFSNDTMAHQLIIDLDNNHVNSTGDKFSTQFSSSTTPVDFSYAAGTSGTFAYLCGIHGFNLQHGFLIVQTPPPPPPPGDNTLLIVGGVVVVVAIVGVAAAMMMRKKKT